MRRRSPPIPIPLHRIGSRKGLRSRPGSAEAAEQPQTHEVLKPGPKLLDSSLPQPSQHLFSQRPRNFREHDNIFARGTSNSPNWRCSVGGKFCRTTLSSRVRLPQTSVGGGWAGLWMVLSNAWVSEALLFLKFSDQEPQIFLAFHLRGRVRAWKLVILGCGILRSALTGSTPRTVRWHRLREPEAQVGFLCVCVGVGVGRGSAILRTKLMVFAVFPL